MTVCSVNTGPGLLPPVHWRILEITVLLTLYQQSDYCGRRTHYFPHCTVIVSASHQSPPCLHIPTLHLDPLWSHPHWRCQQNFVEHNVWYGTTWQAALVFRTYANQTAHWWWFCIQASQASRPFLWILCSLKFRLHGYFIHSTPIHLHTEVKL